MERTRLKGGLIEQDQFLSMPVFQARWDHIPRPPYKVQRYAPSVPTTSENFRVTWSVAEAMETFLAWLYEDRPETVMLLDESFQVMLARTYNWGVFSEASPETGDTGWYGVEVCFQLLRTMSHLDEAAMFAAEMKAQWVAT